MMVNIPLAIQDSSFNWSDQPLFAVVLLEGPNGREQNYLFQPSPVCESQYVMGTLYFVPYFLLLVMSYLCILLYFSPTFYTFVLFFIIMFNILIVYELFTISLSSITQNQMVLQGW